MKKLLIIDSFAIIFRAFYAYPPTLSTPDGQPSNAVYGFTSILIEIIKKFQPEYIVAVFDSATPTIRSTEFSQYKANRKETDPSLLIQIPLVREVLESFSIPVLSIDGYEADDIIGTIIENTKQNTDLEKIVVTGDQDIFQLINSSTSVYLTGKTFSSSKLFRREEVFEKIGVHPEQIPTYKALAGDQSDNIPGVSGIGPKTAAELISKFHSLENLYSNLDKIKESIQKKLEENYEIAIKSLQLATINCHVPLSFDLTECKYEKVDTFKVLRIFEKFGFNSLIKKIDTVKNLKNQIENSANFGSHLVHSESSLNLYNFSDLLNTSSTKFFVDFKIKNYELGFFEIDIYNIKINDGQNIYEVKSEEIIQFLDWINNKTIILFNVKPFLHYLLNKNQHSVFDNINYHDLGFATHVLSAGQFSTDINDIYSYAKIPSEKKYLDRTLHGWSIYSKIADELLKNRIYKLELNVLRNVVLMERSGIEFDKNLAEEYRENLNILKQNLTFQIYDLAGIEFNLNSPKQIGEILYAKRGLPMFSKTKKGSYPTDESTLKKLKLLDPLVELILQYRETEKLLSTYVLALPKYVKSNNRIYAHFDQLGTISGRFSSRNPNMQNIPVAQKDNINIRNLFVSSKKYKFISFDYSQQELRILAALSKEEKMIEAFNQGIDIHALTASEIFGINIENVNKDQRSIGKVINFSIIYGISGYGLSEHLQIDVHTAKGFIDKFYLKYPKLRDYFEEQKELIYSQHYLETALGRKRFAKNLLGTNKLLQQAIIRELLNFPIQGTAADLMKEAICLIYKSLKRYDAKLLLQIHDEFLFEFQGNESEQLDFIEQIKNDMLSVTNLGVNYKVDVKTGVKWGEMQDIF